MHSISPLLSPFAREYPAVGPRCGKHTHSLAVQFRLETSRKSLKIKECTASKRSPISSSDDSLANDSQSTRRRPSSSRHRKRVLDAHLLPSAMLSQLLLRVPQPLGIADAKPAYTWMQQLNLIRQLAIPDRGNVVHCRPRQTRALPF